MLRLVPALLAGLAVLAAAGCGRPQATVQDLPRGPLSKGDYVHAFEISAAGLAQRYLAGTELGAHPTPAEQDRHIAGLQRLLRAWSARLAALRPPAEAARAQVRFVAGVRGFAADLDRARAALRRGDGAGADRLLASGAIVSAGTRADLVAARRAYHRLGYDIRNLDRTPVATP
ncbi:hypothetical protein FSW04_23805 [Baekduia soli]|uniref:DUF4439 domain-containing protein n=1 Tax=Baekduia soli TaxID=496014 RepID=A0A5B8UBB6_9ACTN|nr:hypothetical protein [Baekduia soli]QEC50307.1 hypothetical protein FSW04_23805 [Baekduia soli]